MNIPETYNQLDQWTTVMFLYNSALKAINTKIEILNNEFIHLYNYNPIEHIKSRLKTPESIVKKLKRGGHEVTIPNMIEHLSDIAGIRIICSPIVMTKTITIFNKECLIITFYFDI